MGRPLEYFLAERFDGPRSLGMVVHRSTLAKHVALQFTKLVSQKTDGEMLIQMYQHAIPKSFYKQVEVLSSCSIEITRDDLLSFERYAPLCGLIGLPYFFQDRAQYYRFLKSDIFQEHIFQPLLNNGIRILNAANGWESKSFELLFSTFPVFTPADLQDRNFRSYDSHPANALRKALKSKPTIVHWDESYQAFKNGEIDLFLTPTSYMLPLKLHEVANYVTVINYGYTQNLITAISEREYRKLPPKVQKALNESLEETGNYYQDVIQKQSQLNIEKMSGEFGIPIIQPSNNIWQARFREAIRQICLEGQLMTRKMYEALQQI